MYKITYLNRFDYTLNFTGVVIKNFPDRMLIDGNGDNYQIELLKENIIQFEFLKKIK